MPSEWEALRKENAELRATVQELSSQITLLLKQLGSNSVGTAAVQNSGDARGPKTFAKQPKPAPQQTKDAIIEHGCPDCEGSGCFNGKNGSVQCRTCQGSGHTTAKKLGMEVLQKTAAKGVQLTGSASATAELDGWKLAKAKKIEHKQ